MVVRASSSASFVALASDNTTAQSSTDFTALASSGGATSRNGGVQTRRSGLIRLKQGISQRTRNQFLVASGTPNPKMAQVQNNRQADTTQVSSVASNAKQALSNFDNLLQQTLGKKYTAPKNHAQRTKLAAMAASSLKGNQLTQFLNKAETIGKEFGLNFGLSRSTAKGRKPLNDGVAAKLDASHAAVHRALSTQGSLSSGTLSTGNTGNTGASGSTSSGKRSSATASNPSSGNTTASTTGTNTTTNTSSTTATNTPTAGSKQPTADEIKKQSVMTLMSKTIPNQTEAQTLAMVTRWATADSNYESVSKAELQAACPALAQEWDKFAAGKDSLSVTEGVSLLRKFSQAVVQKMSPSAAPSSTPSSTPSTTPTAAPSTTPSAAPVLIASAQTAASA